LLITELILDNKFNDRSPAEIAAMFSALTCQFDSGKGGNNRQRGAFNNGYNNNHNNGQMASQNATTAATAMPTEGNANGATNQQQQEMPMPEMVSKELLREVRRSRN
jgi:superfamily II RNA helicase